jgi:hypothetical protein
VPFGHDSQVDELNSPLVLLDEPALQGRHSKQLALQVWLKEPAMLTS